MFLLSTFSFMFIIKRIAVFAILATTGLCADVLLTGETEYNVAKDVSQNITEKITGNNIEFDNPIEKIHIVIGIIENLCHEVVYHKHNKIDYEAMENEVIKIIVNLLK